MMEAAFEPLAFSLRLRRSGQSVHETKAWLIPGADAGIWIEEIAACGVAMDACTLYILPSSLANPQPAGVLVVPAEGTCKHVSTRGLPYACVGGKLFLPSDAELDPPVSEAEMKGLLSWQVAILHPGIGLVGFSAGNSIGVHDLVAMPRRVSSPWDEAVAGVALNTRLKSVHPLIAPTFQLVVEMGRDDIATESVDETIPPAIPDKSSVLSIKRFAAWLAGKKPPGGKASAQASEESAGMFSAIWRWAHRDRPLTTSELQSRRDRELQRLLQLLMSDPDMGLRYALPLADDSSRGVASPSGQLGQRETDFNLDSISGGRAADQWAIAAEMRQKLRDQYREAAARELNLGRHRRAAYIFAKLLGDFATAANALKQGRHYREAAILYREKLNDTAAAAVCLEEGGLLTDAIEIYIELKQFEKAGDLYMRIERIDEGHKCYRLAVDQYLGLKDRLAAAQLMEQKLCAPDEALQILEEGWPGSQQGVGCLIGFFRLLGRLGRHDRAIHEMRSLAEQPVDITAQLAERMVDLSSSYPNEEFRHRTADTVRVIAGRRLSQLDSFEPARVVSAVVRLDPEDRLLARDGARYLAALQNAKTTLQASRPARALRQPNVLISSFHLGADVEWKSVVGQDQPFFAFGVRDDRLVLLRGNWDGRVQIFQSSARYSETLPFWMEPIPELNLLSMGGLMYDQSFVMPADKNFPQPIAIGDPEFLKALSPLAIVRDENGVVWTVLRDEDDRRIQLNGYAAATGAVVSVRTIELATPRSQSDCPVMIAAQGGHVLIGHGTQVLNCQTNVRGQMDRQSIDLPSACIGLVTTFPMTRLRVAVMCTEGVMLLWPAEERSFRFAQDQSSPLATFTRGAHLVVASRGKVQVYQTSADFRATRIAEFDTGSNDALLAILPGGGPNDFALIYVNGLVKVFVDMSPG